MDDARATVEAETRVRAEAERQADTPQLPADCRRHESYPAPVGSRNDVALLNADRAVTRGNDRIDRCARWHDDNFGLDGKQVTQ